MGSVHKGTCIGPYRIGRILGQGGMGEVYEATDERIGRRVALKLLNPVSAQAPDALARFFNEARAVNRIEHPGIVQVTDLGFSPSGAPFLVMEYLRGVTLEQWRQEQGGPVAESVALAFAHQLASALAATHQHGIVHRDLKPSNVMVVSDPAVPGGRRLKLLDFGIAKLSLEISGAVPVHTRAGAVLGTPCYMAPELWRGAPTADGRADVYALGILLWELLAGARLFASDRTETVMYLHLHQSPPHLRERVPAISDATERWVHAMLAKAPEERPTMAQLAEKLAESLFPAANTPLAAARSQRARPNRSRLPVIGGLALGLALSVYLLLTGPARGPGAGAVASPSGTGAPAAAAEPPPPLRPDAGGARQTSARESQPSPILVEGGGVDTPRAMRVPKSVSERAGRPSDSKRNSKANEREADAPFIVID
ncbi:MAG: serine/threonine-protein kinase [Polyangia bacterium]